VRNRKRRGEGWIPQYVDVGWSNNLGWYEGFHVLASVTRTGVITGACFGPASTNDHPLAETLFALRRNPQPGDYALVGRPAEGVHLGDSGFAGTSTHVHWKQAYQSAMIAPPQREQHQRGWTPEARRQLASLRQIAETIFAKLLDVFRLRLERPHALTGFLARLAAKLALHNFCIWLNRQLGRANLQFVDLLGW
jgi:Transposase DDE domain